VRMSVVFVDGVAFKHKMAQSELSAALASVHAARIEARASVDALKVKLGQAPLEAKSLAQAILTSKQVALASAVRTNKRLRPARRATLDRCFAVTANLELEGPVPEPATIHVVPKSSGFRIVHEFKLKHRTLQDMARRVIECHFVPRPWQYTHRGVHKAIAKAKQQLQTGHVCFATLDIVEHFASFEASKLVNELPIPQGWVEFVVSGRHLAAGGLVGPLPVPSDVLLHQARRGIPLGSICSPIVAAYCMSRLSWTRSAGLLNYADNFLLLAETQGQLESGIGQLFDAVAKLPGGKFQLKLVSQGHASKSFVFLGHELTYLGKNVSVKPSECAFQWLLSEPEKLEVLLSKYGYLLSHQNKQKALELLAHMTAYATGWFAAFRACDEKILQELKALVFSEIDEHAKKLGFTSKQISEAIQPGMGFRLKNYGLTAASFFDHEKDKWTSTSHNENVT